MRYKVWKNKNFARFIDAYTFVARGPCSKFFGGFREKIGFWNALRAFQNPIFSRKPPKNFEQGQSLGDQGSSEPLKKIIGVYFLIVNLSRSRETKFEIFLNNRTQPIFIFLSGSLSSELYENDLFQLKKNAQKAPILIVNKKQTFLYDFDYR